MEKIVELINKDTVFYIDNPINKDDFFENIFKKLENIYNIGKFDSLKEAIMKKEIASPNMTAIGNELAIPHGIFFDYTYQHEIILPVFYIKNGINNYVSEFDESKVKFLFLIGYNQDTYCTKRTTILPQIAEKFSDENNIEILKQSSNKDEFYRNLLNVFGG